MSIGLKGENLIFLISQPRAGSTLLQQILSNNPEIHTVPETWIALPALYALYSREIDRSYNTEYNRYWVRTAIKGFFQHLPNGEEDYLEGVRKMYAHFYNRAIEDTSKKFFLDKGPRYYHILPELYKVFPEATYIVLKRNPLAVLRSLVNITRQPVKCGIHEFKHDLLSAPRLLRKGVILLGERCCVVKYEDLLKDPDEEVTKICKKIGVEFSREMLNYSVKKEYEDGLGYCNQEEIFGSGRLDATNIDRWASFLEDPEIWRLTNDYLHYLGRSIINSMGYSYDELQDLLDRNHPGYLRLCRTASLRRLIKMSEINAILEKKSRSKLPTFLERYLRYILP